VLVDAVSFLFYPPVHPVVGDHLAVHLGDEHVLLGVAVDQMSVSPGDLLHAVDPLDLIGPCAPG
jgi:hypothetical protein